MRGLLAGASGAASSARGGSNALSVKCTNSASRGPLSARQVTGSAQFAMDTLMTDKIHQEVLDLDPVPVALRGYLVKSDPGGRNFTRRCRWPSW